MATKPKASEKSFWRKRKNEDVETVSATFASEQMEKDNADASGLESGMGNSGADPLVDFEAEVAAEGASPVLLDADSFSTRGEGKDLVDLAVASARKAELAHMLEQAHISAKKEAELNMIEAQAATAEAESSAAKTAAANALSDLQKCEAEYEEALTAADEIAKQIADLQQECEKRIAEETAKYESGSQLAKQNLRQVEEELELLRADADAALQIKKDAETHLDEARAELVKINAEGTENIRKSSAVVEEKNALLESAKKRLQLLSDRIAAGKKDMERCAAEESDMQQQYDASVASIDELREEYARLKEQASADTAALQRKAEEEIAAEQLALDALLVQQSELAASFDAVTKQQADKEQEIKDVEHDLRQLKLSSEDIEHKAKSQRDKIFADLANSKEEVVQQKERFTTAQNEVQQATALLIKANVRVKCAQEQLEQATLEVNDARIAADMAHKLREDAVAAKGSDEASSLLLGKAETVLLATINSANELLHEKQQIFNAAQQEHEDAKLAAAQANADVDEATARANEMISCWLGAEEALVRLTAQVEEEQVQIEQERTEKQDELSAKIAHVGDMLEQLNGELSSIREQVEHAREAHSDSCVQVDAKKAALEELRETLALDLDAQKEKAAREDAEFTVRLNMSEQEHARLSKEWTDKIAQCQQQHQELQEDISSAEEQHEQLLAESAAYESAAAEAVRGQEAMEQHYRDSISLIQSEIDKNEQIIRESRSAAAVDAMRNLEERHRSMLKEQETAEQLHQHDLAEIHAAYQQRLDELSASHVDQEDQVSLLNQLAMERRQLLRQAVDAATEKFSGRVRALRQVEVKRLDNEIYRMREEARQLDLEIAEKKAAFDVMDASYGKMQQRIADLDSEEASLLRDAEASHQKIEAEKEKRLADLSAELDKLEEAAAHKQEEISRLEEELQSCSKAHQDAILTYQEAQAAAESGTDMQLILNTLADLEAKYKEDYAAAERELPRLLSARNNAEAAVMQARVAAEDAELACSEHQSAIEVASEHEVSLGDSADKIDNLRREHDSKINEIRISLAALEERKASLDEEYHLRSEAAEAVRRVGTDLAEELQRLLRDEQVDRERAEKEIADLNTRLAALREDADAKERRFRDTEKTLMNRADLIESAEASRQAAQVAAAKAMAEWQAAQAARETANSLAQQAANSFGSMDKETAEIMRRTSEQLLTAVESATALVEEKEKAYQEADTELKKAEAAVASLQRAVGEAPALLSESRSIWQSAEEDYGTFKGKVDREVPTIRKRLNKYLLSQRQSISSVEEKIEKNRLDAADCTEAVEEISRQRQDLSIQISETAVALKNAEDAATIAISALEEEAEKEYQNRRQLREDAERTGIALAEALQQANDDLEACIAEAQTADAAYNDYRQYYASLTAEFEKSRAEFLSKKEEILAAVEDARNNRDAAAAQEAAMLERRDGLNAELAQLVAQQQNAFAEKERIAIEKKNLLVEVENKKESKLCALSIRRVDVEEELYHVSAAWSDKYDAYNDAARRGEELEAKLARLEARISSYAVEE